MRKLSIGILCPSNIAFNRFLPALEKSGAFEYAGVAVAAADEWFGGAPADAVLEKEREKAAGFVEKFGGRIFESYAQLLGSDVDAVYLPLPPALHFQWAKAALGAGKHAMVEKPCTTALSDTEQLVALARQRGLALHENYMFQYHLQLDWIDELRRSGELGETRLIRVDFGFPFRGAADFRYVRALGGGALLDCGGYTLKLASRLLGGARVVCAHLEKARGFDVDVYGAATLRGGDGATAQVSFGMDNAYRCDLDIWGSAGSLHTGRILTAPDGFEPTVTVKTAAGERTETLPGDDTFGKSIAAFAANVGDEWTRQKGYDIILEQGRLMEEFKAACSRK